MFRKFRQNFIKDWKKNNFVCFAGDIRNRDHVRNWIKKNNLKAVIHLAAIVPIKIVNNGVRTFNIPTIPESI